MAPIRLIARPARRQAGLPFDVAMAGVLTALACAFAGFFGARLFDPQSDLQTMVLLLAMAAAYQVAAFAVVAQARKARA
jgi:hypothetical protein